MTNNDELALKLKAAAERATKGDWRRASTRFNGITATPMSLGGVERMLASTLEKCDAEFITTANPVNILSLLAERDADKKRIEMLERYVNERDAQNQDLLLNIGSLQQRISELREYYEGVIADGSKRIAELEARVSNLQVNRPVVYGDGFYEGYWKARSEQSMSSEDENHD